MLFSVRVFLKINYKCWNNHQKNLSPYDVCQRTCPNRQTAKSSDSTFFIVPVLLHGNAEAVVRSE